MCDKYLESYHKETILEILEDENENKHFSININFVQLYENDSDLGSSLLKDPEKNLEDWDNALKKVQTKFLLQSERNCVFKKHVHCRIFGLPGCDDLYRTKFPRNDDANKFLQISGTVVRMTVMKMLEYQRQYICLKCKHVMTVNAEYEKRNTIVPPKKCGNPEDCKGTNIVSTGELDPEFCKDYQEIKIQETVSKLDVGCIPTSMWVTLEDELVDSCKPGDNITVCGVVKRRWNQFTIGKKMEIELVIKANHILVNNNSSTTSLTTDLKDMFRTFWQTYSDRPLAARDIILKSICPQIFGLYVVKLAIAMTLAGGSHLNDNLNTGVRVRAEPHLLLVGDPGTGKSQLLRFASKIIPRSVLTTGVGSTAAGLTVTAIMENGEWQLEGGALVLSDGGICCIDEFNSMKEHDRTSIHEAMEQQSISVAKASIVCKLNTRCSILAATNPKGNIDPSQPLSMNIALASPLLSRFDLILLLRDKVNDKWDSLVADYILNAQNNTSKLVENIYWTVETLQAYFAVIKKIHPVLTEDSNRILGSYYQAQRRKDSRNKSRTTVRLLDSLVRLSQAHARLMFHEEVHIVDAVVAVILVETAMEADSSVFDLHFDIQNDFPDNPMKNYRELVEIVLKKLHLHDLLEKEVDWLSNKTLSNTISMNVNIKESSSVTELKTESKFFHFQNKNDIKETDSDEDDRNKSDDTERPVNIQKIKRTKNKSNIKPKKIKLNNKNNDVINDLTALDYIPSVFDVNEDDENDLGLDLNFEDKDNGERKDLLNDIEPQPGPSKETNPENEKNGTEEIKQRDDSDKENKYNENTKILELSNHDRESKKSPDTVPKCRQFLNKFRFIPKDDKSITETHNLEISSNAVENKNPKEENTNGGTSTYSENLTEAEDIFKNFEAAPQSTQISQPQFKFKFKKTDAENVKTIFENQEEIEDLDLDL